MEREHLLHKKKNVGKKRSNRCLFLRKKFSHIEGWENSFWFIYDWKWKSGSGSCSVMSNSLWPHGLYRPPPGQNTGVSSLSLLQGSSQPRDQTQSPASQADSLPAEPQGSLRILEWVADPFPRGSPRSSNRTEVSCIAGGFFTNWAIREALQLYAN